MRRCMMHVDTRPSHAEVLADNLSMADYRGHYSHGLNRLDMYVNDIRSGTTANEGKRTERSRIPDRRRLDII